MHVTGLAVAVDAADRLVPALEAERQAGEDHLSAVLPVEAKAGDLRLGDQQPHLTRGKSLECRRLMLTRVAAAHLAGVGECRLKRISLEVGIAPEHDRLARLDRGNDLTHAVDALLQTLA